MRILINSLSANEQFNSVEDMAAAVEQLNECFELFRPAIDVGFCELLYDYTIERRGLLMGHESLQQSISRIGDQDIKSRWYHFTKNRSVESDGRVEIITLASEAGSLEGEATASFTHEELTMGFGGSPACEAEAFDVCVDYEKLPRHRIRSIIDSNGAWKCLPRYEASPKHKEEEYVRARGETVAPMTLGDRQAQECLSQSFLRDGHRYGMFGGKFYKFMLTGSFPSGDVFHGYEVSRLEVPGDIAEKLEGRK